VSFDQIEDNPQMLQSLYRCRTASNDVGHTLSLVTVDLCRPKHT